MKPEEDEIVPDGGVNFLLSEYDGLRTIHQDTKEVGEKRLNFYITYIAAVGTAVISLQGFIVPEMRAWLLLGGGLLILLLGLITYRKMLQRRIALIIYRRRMSRVRAWFLNNYPAIADGLPYDTNERISMDWGSGRLGSTAFSIAIINTSLVALTTFAVISMVMGTNGLLWAVISGTIMAIVSWVFHMKWKEQWMRYGEMLDTKQIQKLDDLVSLSNGNKDMSLAKPQI